jgi:hypothetical protein
MNRYYYDLIIEMSVFERMSFSRPGIRSGKSSGKKLPAAFEKIEQSVCTLMALPFTNQARIKCMHVGVDANVTL